MKIYKHILISVAALIAMGADKCVFGIDLDIPRVCVTETDVNIDLPNLPPQWMIQGRAVKSFELDLSEEFAEISEANARLDLKLTSVTAVLTEGYACFDFLSDVELNVYPIMSEEAQPPVFTEAYTLTEEDRAGHTFMVDVNDQSAHVNLAPYLQGGALKVALTMYGTLPQTDHITLDITACFTLNLDRSF